MFAELKEVKSVCVANFERSKDLRGYHSEDNSGFKVVFKSPNGNYVFLEDFVLNHRLPNGATLPDGSKLIVCGSIETIKVSDHYHLYPVSGSFGVFHGIVSPKVELNKIHGHKNQKQFKDKKETISYCLLDSNENVFYFVEEHIFDKDPLNFDLFEGSKTVGVFFEGKEIGVICNGQFNSSANIGGRLIVHPIAKYFLQRQPTK